MIWIPRAYPEGQSPKTFQELYKVPNTFSDWLAIVIELLDTEIFFSRLLLHEKIIPVRKAFCLVYKFIREQYTAFRSILCITFLYFWWSFCFGIGVLGMPSLILNKALFAQENNNLIFCMFFSSTDILRKLFQRAQNSFFVDSTTAAFPSFLLCSPCNKSFLSGIPDLVWGKAFVKRDWCKVWIHLSWNRTENGGYFVLILLSSVQMLPKEKMFQAMLLKWQVHGWE